MFFGLPTNVTLPFDVRCRAVVPNLFRCLAPNQRIIISMVPFFLSAFQIQLLQVMNSKMMSLAVGQAHYMERFQFIDN